MIFEEHLKFFVLIYVKFHSILLVGHKRKSNHLFGGVGYTSIKKTLWDERLIQGSFITIIGTADLVGKIAKCGLESPSDVNFTKPPDLSDPQYKMEILKT